jgi:DNA-binding response OmpR family regulator
MEMLVIGDASLSDLPRASLRRVVDVDQALSHLERRHVDVVLAPVKVLQEFSDFVESLRMLQPLCALVATSGDPDCERLAILTGADLVVQGQEVGGLDIVAEGRQAALASTSKGTRVVVLDDDDLVLMAVVETLQRAGFMVRSFTDGHEALAHMRREPAHALLTDLMMPGIGGPDVLSAAHRFDPFVRGIAMTGYGNAENAADVMRRGAVDFITKPVVPSELVKSVRKAVEGWHARVRVSRTYRSDLGVGLVNALLVEDNDTDALLVGEMLDSELFQLERVASLEAACTALHERLPDVILLDLNLPDSRGLETFFGIYRVAPTVPSVVLSATNDLEQAIRAVSCGAQDYIPKSELHKGKLEKQIRAALK